MVKQYHDPEYLHRERHEKEKFFREIAEENDVAESTIRRSFEELGVPKDIEKSYKNKDYLKEQYWEFGKSIRQIADQNNVSEKTISRWFDNLGIESRASGGESRTANFKTISEYSSTSGYEMWRTIHNYKDYRVLVHRLLAVAEYGLEETKNKVVHHKNGIRWDNRPENIELMTNSEHTKIHHEQDDLNVKSQD